MRLQNFSLSIENKTNAIEFANEILIIDNDITIENFIVDEKKTKRHENTNLLKAMSN